MPKAEQQKRIVVRGARSGDLERIAGLLSDLGGEPLTLEDAENRLRRALQHPEEEMVVACFGKQVVGLMAFRLRHNVESVSHFGEVSAIVVDSNWRKKGVGRLLMEKAEAMARKRKCLGVWLVSGFGREEEAHEFYRQIGFSCTGKRFVKRFN